jgi:hypothetical protein
MNTLRHLWLTVVQFFRQLSRLPQTFAQAAAQRRERTASDELEVERLDRIRNPSKYRPK